MSWVQIESYAYWPLFAASFIGMAVWESFRPLRPLEARAERRWGIHGVLMAIAMAFSVVVLRASPVVLAAAVADSRFGLLNRPWAPLPLRFVAAVLALDLVKYASHRTMHAVFALWRVHQMHHSDADFDVSTALRVHPLETIFMQGTYLAAVAVLAPPLSAVVLAELLSAFQSLFNHANASLPPRIERLLRLVLVTPDMHRIHHSAEIREQSANLGDIFPWWDRLFGTYLDQPAAGHRGMALGLHGFSKEKGLNLAFLLSLPFRREAPQVASAEAPIP